ncbi:MAG TPA: lipocalin family protein [Draconibacterium sp.]|nr:lipocalin family protein [Draconibacterium sp.]
MENKISFSSVFNWLKSTEMFARPSKQIPGKWQLVEYYIETEDELRNISEAQLKSKKELWNIEFTTGKKYLHQCNLPVSLISRIKNGEWNISKNFITLTSEENTDSNVEFQFAIDKDQLKLLKKDSFGKIEFFGFFSKLL